MVELSKGIVLVIVNVDVEVVVTGGAVTMIVVTGQVLEVDGRVVSVREMEERVDKVLVVVMDEGALAVLDDGGLVVAEVVLESMVADFVDAIDVVMEAEELIRARGRSGWYGWNG